MSILPLPAYFAVTVKHFHILRLVCIAKTSMSMFFFLKINTPCLQPRG